MLATWGYATTWSGARFPGCEDFPAGFGKKYSTLSFFVCLLSDRSPHCYLANAIESIKTMGAANLIPVLLTGALLEFTWKQKQGSFPGDFSATSFPVGFGPYARDEADMIDLRTRELNNGRAAMMGILGMMVSEPFYTVACVKRGVVV